MDIHTCEKLISEMVFEKDIRNPPAHPHRGQFRVGWEAATVKAEIYTEDTLKTLTWHNLGYRLGNKLGNKHPNEINEIFDSFADHYFSRINSNEAQDISVKAYQHPIKLAQQISQIFTNQEEAKWAFDLLQRTFERLRLSSLNDPRFAVTVPQTCKKINFSFGN
jgi:hypothetical protein